MVIYVLGITATLHVIVCANRCTRTKTGNIKTMANKITCRDVFKIVIVLEMFRLFSDVSQNYRMDVQYFRLKSNKSRLSSIKLLKLIICVGSFEIYRSH